MIEDGQNKKYSVPVSPETHQVHQVAQSHLVSDRPQRPRASSCLELAMLKAARDGDLACARELLAPPATRAAQLQVCDSHGRTPLYLAAMTNDAPMVQLLLQVRRFGLSPLRELM